MKILLMWFIMLLMSIDADAQVFKSVLLEIENNKPIANALIQTNANSDFTTSDSNGVFYLAIENNTTTFDLIVSTLNCRKAIPIKDNFSDYDTIYMHCKPFVLEQVTITYLTPQQIVMRAINSIPQNYFDSSFVCPSFYRNYQKINGKFMHLTEARTHVLFRISPQFTQLSADEAISVQALRKSNRLLRLDEFYGDDYKDLLMQNPIYHIFSSSLNPDKLDAFNFYMSSETNDSVWVILYSSKKYTTENHAIDNYNPNDFYGEANEQGTLIIDKQSNAFLFIERKALRNTNYHYPKFNNFLYPDNKYTGEFIDGYLAITFSKKNEKYYPKRILHSFTNEFFATVTYEKVYKITEYFEWFAEEPIFIIPSIVSHQFETYTLIGNMQGKYQADQWISPIPNYYLVEKEILYRDLEEKENLNTQFINNSEK